MQVLQNRGQLVFGVEERSEAQGSPLPAGSVTARDMVEAAKSGYEYRLDERGTAWTLFKKTPQPVLLLDPRAMESAEVREVTEVFRLKRGLTKFPITQEKLNPFPSTYPSEGVTSIDLETRSLLQALYYVSHGIEIPSEHAAAGLVTVTRDPSGQPFDWQRLTVDLFRVYSVASDKRPPRAHVAILYKGYWFYIDQTDQDTKATFSLLVELPEGMETAALLPRAVERGVAFTPGNAFFADGGGERALRLSFSAVPFSQIEEGVRRLADSVRELGRHPERSARVRGPAVPLV